jgi:hypothetical protein
VEVTKQQRLHGRRAVSLIDEDARRYEVADGFGHGPLNGQAVVLFAPPMLRSSRVPVAGAQFIEPCLPSPAREPPSGADLLHEIKHDGYPMVAHRDGEHVRPLSRRSVTRAGSGRIEARTGLRMMPTFPRSPLSFRTASFPRYGWKAGLSDGAFPARRPA